MDIISVDFGNLCRVCLEPSSNLENLFTIKYEGSSFNEILNILAPIPPIQEDESYPIQICESCRHQAVDSWNFRQMCLKSDHQMRTIYEQKPDLIQSIKSEIVMVENHVEEIYIAQMEPSQEQEEELFDSNFTDDLIEEEKVTYDCDHCGKQCVSPSKLVRHMKVHRKRTKTKDYIIDDSDNKQETRKRLKHSCETCDKTFETPSKLQRHMNVHLKDSPKIRVRNYSCPVCGKAFESPSKVVRHLKTVHRYEPNMDTLIKSIPRKYRTGQEVFLDELKEDEDADLIEEEEEEEVKFDDLIEEVPAEIESESIPEHKVISCDTCLEVFNSEKEYEQHMKTHISEAEDGEGESSEAKWKCSHCSKRFTKEISFLRHKIVHSELIEKSRIIRTEPHDFLCVICGATVDEYSKLFAHMRTHRLEYENKEVICRLCSKSFTNTKNIARHCKTHDENATHKCVVCGKMYGMGEDFLEHLMRHEQIKPHACTQCDKSFLKANKLKVHMATHTGETTLHVCQECGKSFAEQEYLKRHMLRHAGHKPHKCELCPKAFLFKSGLQSHMITHTGAKDYSCNTCGSTFTKPETLKKHIRIHTGEKPYTCEMCGMQFTSSGHLSRHRRIHTGEKPYKCEFCDRAYAQSNDLVKHLRIHVGQNTYRCTFQGCSAAFRLYGELRTHLLNHYKEDSDAAATLAMDSPLKR